MKSSIVKRSVVIDGHKTSVSSEDAFWNDLKEIARQATTDVVEGARGDRKRTSAGQSMFGDPPVCVRPSPHARGLEAIFSLPTDLGK